MVDKDMRRKREGTSKNKNKNKTEINPIRLYKIMSKFKEIKYKGKNIFLKDIMAQLQIF